jgi:hypothetical protein
MRLRLLLLLLLLLQLRQPLLLRPLAASARLFLPKLACTSR